MRKSKERDSNELRLNRLLDRLAEMEALVEQMPLPERKIGMEALARIRKELQPIFEALTTRH